MRATATLLSIDLVPAASFAFGMAVTPDDAELYMTRPVYGDVLVLNRATMTLVRSIHVGSPRRMTFDARGATAMIGNEAGYVQFVR